MPINSTTLQAVLDAAEMALAAGARGDDLLTSREWERLGHAVAACHEPAPGTMQETFAVEAGFLVRRVAPANGGEPYVHRCPLAAFEEVAHAIDEMGEEPFVLEDIKQRAKVPWTQANTALAFLKERGIVGQPHRRSHSTAGGGNVHMDALIEYHALAEGG